MNEHIYNSNTHNRSLFAAAAIVAVVVVVVFTIALLLLHLLYSSEFHLIYFKCFVAIHISQFVIAFFWCLCFIIYFLLYDLR